MGFYFGLKCNNCGKLWQRDEGSGFRTEKYHCNKCGKESYYSIFGSRPDLWEQYYLFLDKWKSENGTEEKFLLEKVLDSIHKQIKKHKRKTIGICDCGGRNELYGGILICPDCQSQDISETGERGLWD